MNNLPVSLLSLLRYLQGERRGMGSQLREPTPHERLLAAELFPESVFAPSILIQTNVRLSDVSFWQADIDFHVMHPLLDGVIIRAGQRNWVDSRFRENWSKAKQAGIPRGSYWFYDSRESPRRQAEIWSSQLAGDVGELFHASDFEEGYGGSYGKPGHFKEFMNWFQDFTGLPDERLPVYTGFYWWLARVGADSFFHRFPLWEAWYGKMGDVRVPPPWTESDLMLWQYTSSGDGLLYGVSSKEIDLNWYCCNAAHFSQRFGLGAGMPTDPPTGGSMHKGTAPSNFDVWDQPNGIKIGHIRAGEVVTGSPNNTEWVRLNNAVGGRTPVYTKRTFLGSWYQPVTTPEPTPEPPPPPPPDPEPTVTLKHVIQVYSDGSLRIDGEPYP